MRNATSVARGVHPRAMASNVRNLQVVEKMADVVVARAKVRVNRNRPRLAVPPNGHLVLDQRDLLGTPSAVPCPPARVVAKVHTAKIVPTKQGAHLRDAQLMELTQMRHFVTFI